MKSDRLMDFFRQAGGCRALGAPLHFAKNPPLLSIHLPEVVEVSTKCIIEKQ